MAERAHPEDAGFQDRWFGLKKNKYRQKLVERYELCNPHVAGKRVLDIPCGTGWGTSLLKGCTRVIGVDISSEAVDYAREHYQEPGSFEFELGDMSKIPVGDDSVDVVLCLEGFEHVEKTIAAAFLEECRRVLPVGGLLIMTCPVLDETGQDTGNPYHVYEYPEEELIDILNRSFRVQKLERMQGPDGPEYRAIVENFKTDRYRPAPPKKE